MDYIRELNLHSNTEKERLRTFLARFDLWLDEIDYGVVIEKDNEIIGSCCKLKNIYKCFAVDPAHQGEGMTNRLLTEVSYRVFGEGYLHTFVYTKPTNKTIFTGLGFEEIVTLENVTLLEKGMTTIGQHISQLDKNHHISDKNNGAIVVNGNPFTLGHQYLVETASRCCEQLLVFVVEEDASSFPFADRLALIQAGCAHLSNVIVLPSSQYIISQATFPNYFLRDKDNAFATYAKIDTTVFGLWFAKQLNITARFVGEEPLDPMTNRYNDTMQAVLPAHGVTVHVIPRKANDIGIISASNVRALLKEDKWDDVRKYVPHTTLAYLEQATEVIDRLKQHDRKH